MSDETKKLLENIDGGIDNLNKLAASQLDESRKQTALLEKLVAASPVSAPAPRSTGGKAANGSAPTGGAVFGNYGRSKGRPVAGASENDLAYYGNGCVRSLDDDSKARFHDKERERLTAIVAEMERQGFDVPREWAGHLNNLGPPPPDFDEPPPQGGPSEDDIPF